MNLYFFINNIVVIVLNVFIFLYVDKLEKDKCLCSKHWTRDAVKYGSLIYVAYIILVTIILGLRARINQKILPLFSTMGLLTFVYLVICVVYLFKLKKKVECECSEDWKRKLLLYPLVLIPVAILVGFLIVTFKLLKLKSLRK